MLAAFMLLGGPLLSMALAQKGEPILPSKNKRTKGPDAWFYPSESASPDSTLDLRPELMSHLAMDCSGDVWSDKVVVGTTDKDATGCQDLEDWTGIWLGSDPQPKYGGKGCLMLYEEKGCNDGGDPKSVDAATLQYSGMCLGAI